MRGLKRELTLYFIFRLLLLLFLVIILLGGLILYFSYQILQNETKGNFHNTTVEYLESSIHKKNGELTIENKMKQAIDTQNGWVQILDKKGKAVEGFRVPEEIPDRYEIEDFLTPVSSFPYRLSRWSITIDKEEYIVLYGHSSNSVGLYQRISPLVGDTIPEEAKRIIEQEKAAIYLLDPDGKLLEEYDGGLHPDISFIDIQESYEYDPDAKYDLASGVNPGTGNIVTLVTLNQNKSEDGEDKEKALKAFIAVLLILLVLLLLISINFGVKIGRSVLHIMEWINQLAKGEFAQEKRSPRGSKSYTENKFFNQIFHSLANLTKTLEENKREIEGNEKLREEWIAGLTHDLKTPMSSLYGYSKLLQSDPERWSLDELKIMGNTMTEKSEYIIDLINDLTLSNQLANSSLPLRNERVDVTEIVQNSISSLKLELERCKAEIEFKPEGSAIIWMVDPVGFRRIVDNLLANAVKHNEADTKITVKLEKKQDHFLYLSVRDNGIGMDEITQENLFRRYYRGTHTKEGDSGTGLGMAITRQLILAHGGQLELKSRVGEGTEIIIIFPGQ